MDLKLVEKIDRLIEEYENNLINDTIRLVNIKSEKGEAIPGAPFGEGSRKVLDEMLKMSDKEGFFTQDYNDVGFIKIAMKEGAPDLGIWVHGDVVPAGEGWNFEPYNATLYKNCVIGRGATDNKGQMAAVFNLFRIFKKLGISLNYNPAIYVGSCEESGMHDMKGILGNPEAKGFKNVYKFPKLSLVPDGSFPIGYGAMGSLYVRIKSKKALCNFTLTAGLEKNPGIATAVFENADLPDELEKCTVEKGAKTVVQSYSPPRHGAHPDPEGNMITFLTSALLNCDAVSDEEKHILEFFRDISLDIHGSIFGIDVPDKEKGRTTVFSKEIADCDGCPELVIRVRYPYEFTLADVSEKIKKVCDENGFEITIIPGHEPYINEKDNEVVKTFAAIANEVKGTDKLPYINGATYAHYIPNAYIFGMDGNCPPDDFEKGRGGAHGVDEAVSIGRLKEAMKIYARALLKLNEITW